MLVGARETLSHSTKYESNRIRRTSSRRSIGFLAYTRRQVSYFDKDFVFVLVILFILN